MTKTSFTTRMDASLKADLEEVARLEDRSASYMANQAIRAMIDEHKATRELVETGLKMIAKGAKPISPDAVHEWFLADDDRPFPSAEPHD